MAADDFRYWDRPPLPRLETLRPQRSATSHRRGDAPGQKRKYPIIKSEGLHYCLQVSGEVLAARIIEIRPFLGRTPLVKTADCRPESPVRRAFPVHM